MDISKTHLHWRASTYKGKTYKSYSLARAVREGGKNRKEIILPLGKLSAQELEKWQKALKAAKGQQKDGVALNELVVRANYDHLDVAVALEAWRSWGLDQVFSRSSNHSVSLAAVAAALTVNRCIEPASKSGVASWFSRTTLPLVLGMDAEQMNPSRIFRDLDAIEKLKTELCDYLYKEHLKRDPESMKSVFYDLSSTTFSGTKCLLMGWGHCKEGYDNHIVLALVVNKKGLPVYWATLSGNTADVTTIEWLLNSLDERFKIATPALVFDRGMVSAENLKMLEDRGIQYISAMDKNQLAELSGLDFSVMAAVEDVSAVLSRLINSGKFSQFDDTTYYHEVPITDKARRYILCFNPQLFEDQRSARRQALARFLRSVKQENQELLDAQKSRNEESTLKKFSEALSKEHLEGCVNLVLKKKRRKHETEKGERIVHTFECVVEVDHEKMLEKGKLDGFWMLVTNRMDMVAIHADQVIRPYREKVIIESSFRDIKSCVEISPVHVWTVDHVKAHYTICVLAHLINRTLDLMLKEQPGQLTQDTVSHIRLFEELAPCHLNHLQSEDGGVDILTITKPTDKQKELLSRIGFTHILKEVFNAKSLAKKCVYV
ncbi:MAG: IS1634 family transposase [Parachlamydiaceae bacterium]